MSFSDNDIHIGISACLTGQEVRFDKSHKKSNFCMNELGKYVRYHAFCPEMAVGLPTPRATVRQIKHQDVIKVSRPDGSGDITQALKDYGQTVARQYDYLTGFIFCAKSPSCGMERVKVYSADGKGSKSEGIGKFAEQIMLANPLLPCEENGRLNDPAIRENFVMRLYVYKQLQSLMAGSVTKNQLFQFHAQHKYLLMAHHVESYKVLGRFLAESMMPAQETLDEYARQLMSALKHKATRKTHANTLLHLLGYFKRDLSSVQKQEVVEKIDHYRQGLLPWFAPVTLIKHYLREFPKEYLINQSYFDPHPLDLKLRINQ